MAYRSAVTARGMDYKQDDGCEAALDKIAVALTSGRSSGLLLAGKCGLGKTTAVSAIRATIDAIGKVCPAELSIRAGLVTRSTTDITRGVEDFDKLCNFPLLCLEDLGREASEAVEYGNRTSPIRELIERRYNACLFTIITTNLTAAQILDKYGERVADRLEEMLDVVIFKGKSFRQKK